ncbi:MAG: hypothetical protein H7328_06485 [Bdellovibrio sp.]|nr:hypothetical protein [Bdellovibrio sp.]
MSENKPKSVVDLQSTADFFVAAIAEAHQKACENSEFTYIDPETGLQVLTAYYMTQRGYCCTNRCRHCPYGIHELDKKTKKD